MKLIQPSCKMSTQTNPTITATSTVGTNFTHKGLLCKKMRQAFDMDKLHAVNPTSTTPHGNASVEPAYKSWL